MKPAALATAAGRYRASDHTVMIRAARHGLPLFLPVCTLLFLSSGPHRWDYALLWTLPVWLCVALDLWGPRCDTPASDATGDHGGTALLYALSALQVLNIGLLLPYASALSFDSAAAFGGAVANIAALRIMTGTTSCCSGIATAHELIHRRARHQRWMGRMLLWTVLYDHFAIEHVRGHHRLASTAADPATARYGESFREYWRRALQDQWRSAWCLEDVRLARLSGWQRWSRHRVLHGVLIQAALVLAIAWQFGPIALGVFLYQAYAAVRLLETVNYFQHWGLSRQGERFAAEDAWATDSWLTRHLFLGLAHHADHHQYGGKPYHRLQQRAESPRLPCGYFGLALLIKFDNARFRELLIHELRNKGLGPYRLGNE